MPTVTPFRGYLYNPEKIKDISDVVTQPYDRISAEMRQGYLDRHPHNIVRIIKNQDHREAAAYLERWMAEGTLCQDPEPCFYPYQQIFQFEGETITRLGLIGLVSLEDGEASVMGHERVLSSPLEDRINLIRSTEANDGLIFMLYSHQDLQPEGTLADFTEAQQPIRELVDEYGTTHRIWRLPKGALLDRFRERLADHPLYIADGHHRFQSALVYARECREKGWKPAAPESFDKRMVALFNMESPGLRILPTHRGIRNLDRVDLPGLLTQLGQHFEVSRHKGIDSLASAMQGEGIRLGMMARGDSDCLLLRLRPGAEEDPAFMPPIEGPSRRLDVNVLHEGILGPLLGIDAAKTASQEHVDYFQSRGQLAARLEAGDYQLAFFLNSTRLDQVRELAERGEKMPQKSTDFHPKLLTGLVLMKMQIEKPKG